MRIKAIILDLDNTIYPVTDIGDKLFESLFTLIENNGEYEGNLKEIKSRIMRQPFQVVARNFSFSRQLIMDCLRLLSDLTYEDSMKPFDDYETLRNIQCKKFLVTTGFTRLQQSKIKQLNIGNDFEKIFVIDPNQTTLTKKDIFQQILEEYNYTSNEVLVVGDDPDSEIKAANELEIKAVLYNNHGEQPGGKGQAIIKSFNEISDYLN